MRSGNMPKSLYQNWQFAVEVNGFDVALFKKGQEPKTEFEEVAFAPAGSMFDQKVAGRVKFEDITLEKGILQDGSDEAAREWIKKQVDVNAVVGGLPTTTCAISTSSATTEPATKRDDGPCTARGSRSWSTTNSRARTPTTPSRSSAFASSIGPDPRR